ncbi:MAG: hypothetical protein Q9208_008220 [Pyrenodesmia sp. 3 TL-2023]
MDLAASNSLIHLLKSLVDYFVRFGGLSSSEVVDEHHSPHLQFDVLNFRHQQYLRDQVDVFNILRSLPSMNKALLGRTWDWRHSSIISRGIDWRYNLRGSILNFWDVVRSDLPSQLIESTDDNFDTAHVPNLSVFDDQILSQHHAAYSNAVLVRDSFQIFHRSDGLLLIMSPMVGVNSPTKDFQWAVQLPPSARLFHKDHHDLEWLTLNIIADLSGSPISKTYPDLQQAYTSIIRNLVSIFPRHESIKLVREYIACMNELSQIYATSEEELERLNTQLVRWQNDGESRSSNGERPAAVIRSKIQNRIAWIKRHRGNLPRMLNDLKSSLDVLFQLRTMEQNELAIIVESNNKAIVVFTIVTIIFLPLSFFTSYFGMNLKGVVDTDKTERYFWAVCGTVTICIVSLTVIFGFKNRLYAWIWENREFVNQRIRNTQF